MNNIQLKNLEYDIERILKFAGKAKINFESQAAIDRIKTEIIEAIKEAELEK